jgi:aspartyl-tRNA(Asn)/glutamyl-tRNA(Gln) amidotransferase subunit A
MSDPADLSLVESSAALRAGTLSATELLGACLARIAALDGPGTFDGAPDAVNAWVRLYEEDARTAAGSADGRHAAARGGGEPAGPLCGIPLGLKDLYAVAGKPLSASSRVDELAPDGDCAVWARLRAAGMVLVGHLHTHEWAAGGTTDQVGNPWALDRTAGGSSGGSAAALAARMVPATTGTDTAGSLRIPSALSGTSTLKPTRGTLPLDGVIPLSASLDHPGPMARTLADCRLLWAGMLGEPVAPSAPGRLDGVRLAVSPRVDGIDTEAEVIVGLEATVAAARGLGAEIVAAPPPDTELEVPLTFFELLGAEMLAYHRRYEDRRGAYRPSTRELLELNAQRALSAGELEGHRAGRLATTEAWARWFAEHRIDALLEPTVALVAPPRGHGYDHFVIPDPYVLYTYLWDWTGFPVAALPAGLGAASGLPVGVSVVAAAGADERALAIGEALQAELGVPMAPA